MSLEILLFAIFRFTFHFCLPRGSENTFNLSCIYTEKLNNFTGKVANLPKQDVNHSKKISMAKKKPSDKVLGYKPLTYIAKISQEFNVLFNPDP